MATLTVIWWRDIPAQVIARDGRRASEDRPPPALPGRDRQGRQPRRQAAYNDYIEEWRKVARACGDDLEAEVTAEVDRLETDYDKHRLAALIQSGGVAGGPALAPAHDETPKRANGDATDGSAEADDVTATHTVVGSATREVVIGDDRPFVIIGERINPTGRKLLAEEMKAGDFSRVERDTIAQVEAGAHMLDVNAGIPLADEPAILARTIQLVQSLTDLPLSIDSLDRRGARGRARRLPGQGARQQRDRRGGAARAGPAAREEVRRGGRRDQQRRDRHQRGPRRPVRGREADRRAGRRPRHPARGRRRRPAADADRGDADGRPPGLPDPRPAARRARASTRPAARSNVSFGLPNREGINGAFLAMAIASGLTSAITNPIAAGVREAVMAADVLMGNDRDAARWIRTAPRSRRRTARPGGRRDESTASRRRRRPAERRGRRTPSRSSSSRRRAGAAGSRRGRRSSTRRGRSASTSTRSAAGAGSAAAARSSRASAASRSTASSRRPEHLTPARAGRGRVPRASKGLAAGSPAELHRPPPRRRRHRRPAGEPGPPPGRPQGPRRPRLPHRPGRPPPLRRGASARARLAVRRPRAGSRRRSSASGACTTSRRTST